MDGGWLGGEGYWLFSFHERLNPLLAGSLISFFWAANWLSGGEINCIVCSLFCVFIIIIVISITLISIISTISISFVALLNFLYLNP